MQLFGVLVATSTFKAIHCLRCLENRLDYRVPFCTTINTDGSEAIVMYSRACVVSTATCEITCENDVHFAATADKESRKDCHCK
jgi:hypothetical protein